MSLDGVSSNPFTSTTSETQTVTGQKKSAPIEIFKEFFTKKTQEREFADVKVSDVDNLAKQTYNELIRSGAKVIESDPKTGWTTFDNGIKIYYIQDNSSARIEVYQADNSMAQVIASDGQDSEDGIVNTDNIFISEIDANTGYETNSTYVHNSITGDNYTNKFVHRGKEVEVAQNNYEISSEETNYYRKSET